MENMFLKLEENHFVIQEVRNNKPTIWKTAWKSLKSPMGPVRGANRRKKGPTKLLLVLLVPSNLSGKRLVRFPIF